MTPRRNMVVASLLVCLAGSTLAWAAAVADPLPTPADAQAAYDAGRYPEALQAVTRLLAIKGKMAEAHDRHALLRLKAETYLRVAPPNPPAAAQAFGEAAKSAADGPATADDLAAEMLLKRVAILPASAAPVPARAAAPLAPATTPGPATAHAVAATAPTATRPTAASAAVPAVPHAVAVKPATSPSTRPAAVAAPVGPAAKAVVLVYQPRRKAAAKPAAVGVVEPADRKLAVAELYADELEATAPKLAAADKATALPPVLEVLPALRNLRWLEMSATGSDAKARKLGEGLVTKVGKLLDAALKDTTGRVDTIEQAASVVITQKTPMIDPQMKRPNGALETTYRRTGPTSAQSAALRDALATCQKIHATCDELGGSLGTTGKEFDAQKAAAADVGTRVQKLINTNWNQRFNTPPPPLK
ncbi:MAG: hypothetical protein JWO31_667 [Phycisphaerales bacterium]|nr:hypothetical protein [Phycisphaerales bacterium]